MKNAEYLNRDEYLRKGTRVCCNISGSSIADECLGLLFHVKVMQISGDMDWLMYWLYPIQVKTPVVKSCVDSELESWHWRFVLQDFYQECSNQSCALNFCLSLFPMAGKSFKSSHPDQCDRVSSSASIVQIEHPQYFYETLKNSNK